MPVSIQPLGDHAITITFGDHIDENINKQVLALFHHLQQQNIPAVKDIIPAYTSLTIVYDIMMIRSMHYTDSAFSYMHTEVENALRHIEEHGTGTVRTMQIPVCYDVSLGLDLQEMATQKKISVEEIISLHSSQTYHVYMIGFMPGFPYMGKVDAKIATPRKSVPRKMVFAGSVGIADFQTGIYPFNSPGGWNIIGRTPLMMFNLQYKEPCLLQPGDKIEFVPVSLDDFYALKP
jgi:inhibitor of KinA